MTYIVQKRFESLQNPSVQQGGETVEELTVLNVAPGDVHDTLTKFTKRVVFHVLCRWKSHSG